MIYLIGKISLTCGVIFVLCLSIDFFTAERFPTADRVNVIVGGLSIVVGVACAVVYALAEIWGDT